MLIELLGLLRGDRTRSLRDLAQALNTTLEMVEIMLENLERMGYVRQISTACGKGCGSCEVNDSCPQISTGRIWALIETDDDMPGHSSATILK
jgi:hypothetical protein